MARELRNNHELFSYLLTLSKSLAARDHVDLAEKLERASGFAFGTSSSEFLHAAETALINVKSASVLDEAELSDLEGVIQQIEDAFRKIGGA